MALNYYQDNIGLLKSKGAKLVSVNNSQPHSIVSTWHCGCMVNDEKNIATFGLPYGIHIRKPIDILLKTNDKSNLKWTERQWIIPCKKHNADPAFHTKTEATA